MDSRISFHVCPNRTWFKYFKKTKGVGLLVDIRPYQILDSEKISMEMLYGCSLDLHDFRFIFKLKMNLIYLITLDANGYNIGINKVFIKVNMGVVTLMKASLKDKLYVLYGHKKFVMARMVVSKEKDNTQRLNLMFDCINMKVMAEVCKKVLFFKGKDHNLKCCNLNSVKELYIRETIEI